MNSCQIAPKKRIIQDTQINKTRAILHDLSINTVCDNARCPNLTECFAKKSVTFMILGNICTRYCRFCATQKGLPSVPDSKEIKNILKAIEQLSLNYIVLTSVSRDDLEDGGASFFAETIKQIKQNFKNIFVEVLVPDFGGKVESVELVVKSGVDVFGHNMETVKRLYPEIRPEADYKRSLKILKIAKKENSILTKSGIMLGLKESQTEIEQLMFDLRDVGCDVLVLGQYLRASASCVSPWEYIKEETFACYKEKAYQLGFKYVISEPFARSSYRANRIMKILPR